jgi:O-antigen ligase
VINSVARINHVLRLDRRWAWLTLLLGLAAFTAGVAVATRLNMLPLALGLGAFAIVAAASVRWPLLGLAGFAALIPIEGAVLIEGFGTLSRFAGILFAVTYGVPRVSRLAFTAMPTAGWAYLAWAIVSLGWAIDTGVASAQLFTVIQLFIVAVLVADFVIQQPGIVRPVLWTYSLSAAATALIGFQSYLVTDARSAALEDQNPAQYAAVLLPALVFGVHEALNGNRRLLGGAIALATILGVVISGTRGAWLAVVLVVPFFIFPRVPLRRRIMAVMGAVAVGILLLQLPGVADFSTERLTTALSTGGAGRTDIWTVAATIYASHPILGVGWANFPVAYTGDVVRASGIGFYTYSGAASHNIVIGTVVELGLVGLGLLALFLVPLVLRRGSGSEATVIQAALAALLVLAFFLDMIGNHKELWLMIGLAAGLTFAARPASGPDPDAGLIVDRDAEAAPTTAADPANAPPATPPAET